MVREKFAVRLTPEERERPEHMVRAGKGSARVINRARSIGYGLPYPAQDRRGLAGAQGGRSFGRVPGHGVPHEAALRRGRVGRGAQGPAPSPAGAGSWTRGLRPI